MKLINTLRLILAGVWLLLGAALCIFQALHPESPTGWVKVGGVPVSIGWAALLLGLWNIARWWGARSALALKRQQAALAAQRDRHRPHRPAGPPPEPNPDFDFNDRPPNGV